MLTYYLHTTPMDQHPFRSILTADKYPVVGGTSGLQTEDSRRSRVQEFRGDTGLGTRPRGLGCVGRYTQGGERPAGLGNLGSWLAAIGYVLLLARSPGLDVIDHAKI